jgi:cytochrome c-type biogenesis protein CcmE
MNPTRKRRLLLILALLAASGVAAALVTLALRENITYLYTPSQVFAGEASEQAVFRLGGMVAKDSLKREDGTLKVQFGVTDGDAVMTAHYEGILPDLFRENQAVIATGRREGDVFIATQVLAKHDEQYMPREVAEAMGKAHDKHKVDDKAADVAPADDAKPGAY